MAKKPSQRGLRSGYTTGACAAAAAKAAVLHLLEGTPREQVSILFPDGSAHSFELCRNLENGEGILASVVKDAGDDPDVTNGAEIGAIARLVKKDDQQEQIQLISGEGVGMVTKPGLPVAVGKPAINPTPQRMIRSAVAEALAERHCAEQYVEVSIFVRDGQELAKKTLNKRLGIIGGLSILGTTGIVKPISAKAWTDTIEASMKVAKATGLDTVLLSTGRTSERAAQERLHLPEEALVEMGDYLKYALDATKRHGFATVVITAMWAKLLKAALGIPQTHVRNGALEPAHAAQLLVTLGLEQEQAEEMAQANTAREIYDRLKAADRQDLIHAVCKKAQQQAQEWSGRPVSIYLVTSEDGIVHHVPH
ncbi:MAG: cobalt-precorrin-6A synthase [Desulfobulbus propionicus]|nr:MAG: cobalt-precorrin-6A synthase [Desulfobulbus propionicus]